MKKLFLLLLLLAACSRGPAGPAPSEVVSDFLAYVQAGEFAEASELVSGGSPLGFDRVEEEYRRIFEKLSYEHILEETDGSEAFVTLTVTAFDFGLAMEELMAEAFYWVFMDITAEELAEMLETSLIATIESEFAPMLESEVTVRLERSEDGWLIAADDAFADAVTGGLFSFAEYVGGWQD